MRVLLISLDVAPRRSSGLAVYAELLARGLAEAGHQVSLIASYTGLRPDVAPRPGVRLIWIPQGKANWISFAYRAARVAHRLAHEESLDVVHFLDARFAYACRGPYVASLFQSFHQQLAAEGGRPYHSSWVNLLWRYGYYTLARHALERRALARARACIAPSQAIRDEFVQHCGLPPERVAVVPLGIDTDHFSPRAAWALRERLGLLGQRVLLHVGFCTPRKGLQYLSAALTQAPSDVRLCLIGRWEQRYRERVYHAWGESASKVMELGYIPDEEMPLYYSMADLLVFPSLLEGFGLPLAEAMSCGLPVVATAVGSIPEVVGDVGLLVPPRDPQALAEAVLSLLTDRGGRRERAERGRAWVTARFHYPHMAEGTLAAYQQALGSQSLLPGRGG